MLNALGIACAVAMVFVPARGGVVIDGERGPVALQTAAAPVEGTWTSDVRSGWTDATGERRWQFNLRSEADDSHWGFGIRPSEIEGLGADELVRFRIHKVTPAYIREMRDVGFAAVTDDQLVRMRIHKVDARFVKDARADGYAMATPGDAIDLAIRGPRYSRARRQ